jgi:hypothetical protein
MKGEPVGGCTSYLTITPGTYKIYTSPWGNMSNTVQFIVTASNSQVNSYQPSITVLSPTSGPIGTSVTITGSGFAATGNTISFGDWQSPNVSSSNGGTSITFTVPNVALCYSDNGPTACQTYIAGSRVPATYNVQVSTSIVIGKTSNVLPFYVTAPTSVSTSQPSITVLSPNGGEVWKAGNAYQVTWQSNNTPNLPTTLSVVINLILPNGTTCYIGSVPIDQRQFTMTPMLGACGGDPTHNVVAGQQYKIGLQIPLPSDPEHPSYITDNSDNYFIITNN